MLWVGTEGHGEITGGFTQWYLQQLVDSTTSQTASGDLSGGQAIRTESPSASGKDMQERGGGVGD